MSEKCEKYITVTTGYILITRWVLFKKTLKELTTSGPGTLQVHYEVIFERNQGVLSQSIRQVLFDVLTSSPG